MSIKAISLWEPWATLMAIGAKKNETRSWPTKIRGEVAICAAKKWNGELACTCTNSKFSSALGVHVRDYESEIEFYAALKEVLSLGSIVAVGRLVDRVQITTANMPIDDEYFFGDYTPGRFMWKFKDVVKLEEPIPYPGAQGFFNLTEEVSNQIVDRNYELQERLAILEENNEAMHPVHIKNKAAKEMRIRKGGK